MQYSLGSFLAGESILRLQVLPEPNDKGKAYPMATSILKMTVDTMTSLPVDKQEEVYDFARFLKASARPATRKNHTNGSILGLVGIGASGKGDIAVNHDNYLYE